MAVSQTVPVVVQRVPPPDNTSRPQYSMSGIDMALQVKMLTINLPMFDLTGHVYDFFDKFRNFSMANGFTEHQIIRLIFGISIALWKNGIKQM